MPVTQESLLETADTIQNIFDNHRQFRSTPNTLAATPAPADLDQPGTGVGAILGEELNITVDQVNNENNRPEQSENRGYPSDLPRPQFTMNLPGPSDFTVAHILNGRAPTRDMLPQLDELGFTVANILNRHAPTGERPCPCDRESDFTVACIVNGCAPTRDMPTPLDLTVAHILNRHASTWERPRPRDELAFTAPHIINGRASTRNFPRPSPYTLEGRPRKSSNSRGLRC